VAQADEPTGGAAAPVPPPDGPVVVVGDSLAVGMRATFDGLVAPRPVSWNVKAGITTPQGLLRLRQTLAVVTPAVVVVSLGTNDGPDPRRFRDRLRRVMGLVPADACVVWPDIYRPARKGPYTGLNRVLREEARRDGRLVVVGWQQLVRAHRVALPDGLHPDPAGFDARSRLVGAAVAGVCGS
jgi:lysophospholipase L1-like esterase